MPALTHGKKKKILYLGTDPAHFKVEGEVTHWPVIKIVPRPDDDPSICQCLNRLHHFTHFIFTSKNAVQIFFHLLRKKNITLCARQKEKCISIGSVTTKYLAQEGIAPYLTADVETQEGLVDKLKLEDLVVANILLPRSSLSRPILSSFLADNKIPHLLVDLYDTVINALLPQIDLYYFDEIVFTSPSTVTAFFSLYKHLPGHVLLRPMGPITAEALKENIY